MTAFPASSQDMFLGANPRALQQGGHRKGSRPFQCLPLLYIIYTSLSSFLWLLKKPPCLNDTYLIVGKKRGGSLRSNRILSSEVKIQITYNPWGVFGSDSVFLSCCCHQLLPICPRMAETPPKWHFLTKALVIPGLSCALEKRMIELGATHGGFTGGAAQGGAGGYDDSR